MLAHCSHSGTAAEAYLRHFGYTEAQQINTSAPTPTSQNTILSKAIERRLAVARRRARQWVSTGDEVGSMYSETTLGSDSPCTTTQPIPGDGTTALPVLMMAKQQKSWGNKQGFHQAEMERLHTQASKQIFNHRNNDNNPRGDDDEDAVAFFDLHGLHVAESRTIIEEELAKINSTRHRFCHYHWHWTSC